MYNSEFVRSLAAVQSVCRSRIVLPQFALSPWGWRLDGKGERVNRCALARDSADGFRQHEPLRALHLTPKDSEASLISDARHDSR